MRTTTFQSYHPPPSQTHMASAQSSDGQGQLAPPVSPIIYSRSVSPTTADLNSPVTLSPSASTIQDAIRASSSQSPIQPSSSSAISNQVSPITAASPAVLSNSDPNASIQSILANSRKDSTPTNGQLPTWSIQSGPNMQTAPHPHHPVVPIVSQVGTKLF